MLECIYNQKITILNKLKRSDNVTNLDVWQKTVINDAAWYTQVVRDVTNNAVQIGSYIVCLIPRNHNFLEYFDWKQDGNQEGHYTMSTGDYLVLGEVSEEITAANVVATMTKYEPNVCLVKHFEPLHERFGTNVQLRVEGS